MTDKTTKIIEKTVEIASNNSDAIQNKVVGMLDALQNGAVELGSQVVKYTPEVVDAGLWVVRIDGLNSLFWSLICFLFCSVVLYKIIPKAIKHHNDYCSYRNANSYGRTPEEKDEWTRVKSYKDSYDKSVLCWGIVTVATMAIVPAILTLTKVWQWVAVFEPKLYLAKQIIASVVK